MWWIFPGRKRLGNSRIVITGLFCDTERDRTAFSPGTPTATTRRHRHVSDNGGTCGVSTSKLVDMQSIRTTRIYDCVCRRVDSHLHCIFCSCCEFAFCPWPHARRTTTHQEMAVRTTARDPQTRRVGTHGIRIAHTEGLRTPVGERDAPAQCNGRRSLDLPSMYTNWSDVCHPDGPTAENHRFSPTEICARFLPPRPKGGTIVGRVGPSHAPAHTIAVATRADPPPPPPPPTHRWKLWD